MLEGLTVLDFSRYIPGPYASSLFAKCGAEVIQVEMDSSIMKHSVSNADLRDLESVEAVLNRGKKKVSLDLRADDGRKVAQKLAQNADVIIEGFRPGIMEHFQLDFESIYKKNDQVIYCSLSGYGQKGELASFGSHDLNYMALSGMLSQMKSKENTPVLPHITIADYLGGSLAVVHILAALVERARTGHGKHLDVSLLEESESIMGVHHHIARKHGKQDGISLLNGEIISYQIYETKDEKYVALAAIEEKFWANFCEGVGRIDLLDFHFSRTEEQNDAYIEMLSLFKSRTFKDWTAFGRKVDCCLTPILEPGENFVSATK